MKVEKDVVKNEYNVSISDEELYQAFQSEANLNNLMYDIVKNTYGKNMADEMFGKGEKYE